ncbi:MAG: NAD-dependent epimerase/dehydratase family protein [Acidobacteria bacterium]|nr:NAD-dependent epimerase/dehydratase family protein [Acidobacteriota bacterium]
MVLVTGATGAVGPYVVAELCGLGYRVRSLSCWSVPSGGASDGVDARIGDVTDPAAVQAAMADVESVIHMAALVPSASSTGESAEEYRRVNVDGTAAVVDAAIRAGVRRIVFFSTINVYGSTGGSTADELTTPHPDSLYGLTKRAAEQIVLSALDGRGQPMGVVLRVAAVYGSRVAGNYRRLLLALARNRFVPIGQGENRRTLIYVKDVASAAVLCMTHPDASGGIFNVTDGEIHSMKEILCGMCDALGRARPKISFPIGPVRAVAATIEDLARLVGLHAPVSRAALDKYTEDIAVGGQRIHSVLGFTPRYDMASGWREAVREMRARGEV